MLDWKAMLENRLAARRLDATLHVTVIEELTQHLDDRYRSLLAQGATAAEAERSVLLELEDEALDRELRRIERAMPPPVPALGVPPGIDRRTLARGCPLRDSCVVAQPGLHGGCRDHARARRGRHHRHLLGGQRGHAAAAAMGGT